MKLFTIGDEIDEDGEFDIETCRLYIAETKEQVYEMYRNECLEYMTKYDHPGMKIETINELKINEVDTTKPREIYPRCYGDHL